MTCICTVVLIGLPAAGKTSLCQWLLAKPTEERPFSVIHICYDDFIEQLSIDSPGGLKSYRSKMLQVLEAVVKSLQTDKSTKPYGFTHQIAMSLHPHSDRFLLLIDDNNYYRSMRYELYQFCRRHRIAYAQIFLSVTESLSLARNAERKFVDQVPTAVLKQMSERLEPPSPQKYPWESNVLMLDAATHPERGIGHAIIKFLLESFTNVPPMTEKGEKNADSCQKEPAFGLHHLDLLLRQQIKALLEFETETKKKQTKALMMNKKRKHLLQHLRQQKGIIWTNDLQMQLLHEFEENCQ